MTWLKTRSPENPQMSSPFASACPRNRPLNLPLVMPGSKWKEFLGIVGCSPEGRVLTGQSRSCGAGPVNQAAGSKPMRGRRPFPQTHSCTRAVRPRAGIKRTHLPTPGGARLALSVVLNRSCWSLVHCYFIFQGERSWGGAGGVLW